MPTTRNAFESLRDRLESDPKRQHVLMIWAFLSNLAGPGDQITAQQLNREIAQRRPVANLVKQTLGQTGFTEYESLKANQVIQMLITDLQPINSEVSSKALFENWIADPTVSNYLEVNEYNGIRWFNKEHFENLLWYQRAARLLTFAADNQADPYETLESILKQEQRFAEISQAEEKSEYQLDKLLELLDQE